MDLTSPMLQVERFNCRLGLLTLRLPPTTWIAPKSSLLNVSMQSTK